MNSELNRAHEIANKIIDQLKKDPRYLERFAQNSSSTTAKESESLSPKEIAEIEKIIEEKGYKLPELKNKIGWNTFSWWR